MSDSIDYERVKDVLVETIGAHRRAAMTLSGESREAVMGPVRAFEAALLLVGREIDAAPSAPKVDLPTEPTLGWANWDLGLGESACLAVWVRNATRLVPVDSEADGMGINTGYVTAFTSAVAVPKDALDVLREKHAGGRESPVVKCGWVSDFLAAVDKANGGAA